LNLILLEPAEADVPLAHADPRAVHILTVLRRGVGDAFDAGIVNGPKGKATITAVGTPGIAFEFKAASEPPPADPIHLLLALPRPQTARKILGEATTLGVASMRFFQSDKGEPSYASSTLWSTSEWRRHLRDGAAQAFDTRIPEVHHANSLAAAISGLPDGCVRIALDNYEASAGLAPSARTAPLVLAYGPERGWSPPERDLLRAEHFTLAHLGERVLRSETAVVASLAIVKAPRA
jgi:16S rRNA (uracil1498-N3)-methyltransferase